jgi:hypothetical protein
VFSAHLSAQRPSNAVSTSLQEIGAIGQCPARNGYAIGLNASHLAWLCSIHSCPGPTECFRGRYRAQNEDAATQRLSASSYHSSYSNMPPSPSSGSVEVPEIENYAVHVLETSKPRPPVTWGNSLEELDWINTGSLCLSLTLAFVGAYFTKLRGQTALFSCFYYWFTGLSERTLQPSLPIF